MNLLVDTSGFIAAAHHRPYRHLLSTSTSRGVLIVSSVITMELYAGFRSQEARRAFNVLHLKSCQLMPGPRGDGVGGKTLLEDYSSFPN